MSTTSTLGELAALAGGRLVGPAGLSILGVAPLTTATGEDIALVATARYRTEVPGSRAGALLVAEALEDGLGDARPRIVVDDPHAALIPILERLHPEASGRPGVHPTAMLGRGAELGASVEVGAYAVIGDGA